MEIFIDHDQDVRSVGEEAANLINNSTDQLETEKQALILLKKLQDLKVRKICFRSRNLIFYD